MNKPAIIVWFRRDLRLDDNPAWNAAVESDLSVVPVYLHCPKEDGKWRRGEASHWWLHHALEDLDKQLNALGHTLVIRSARDSLSALLELANQLPLSQVVWNRNYEPSAVKRDTHLKSMLKSEGYEVQTFNGNLLFDPLEITNKSGSPFKVFTPFWKHCSTCDIKQPISAKAAQSPPLNSPVPSARLSDLTLLPKIGWTEGIEEFWKPTRAGGLDLLRKAVAKASHYQSSRDIPSEDGTSRLSPYLHFGQISPAEFHKQVLEGSDDTAVASTGILRQLFWREFSAHLLYHFPHSQDHPLRPKFEDFPWDVDAELLGKWQRGETGFPLIDAGMRQLWTTGWMHNRVRMVVASFLVKQLLQPWQEGAHWFWDTLVDADLANNTMGWQWVGGCGADASPYFRVFNPILQSKKFDPSGDYIRKWVPELSSIPNSKIHTPWELEPLELLDYDVTLGSTYPHPIISHENGRKRALAAYASFKQSS